MYPAWVSFRGTRFPFSFCDWYLVFAAAQSTWFLLFFNLTWRCFSRWVAIGRRRAWYLSFLARSLCRPSVWNYRSKVTKTLKGQNTPCWKWRNTNTVLLHATIYLQNNSVFTPGACWNFHSFWYILGFPSVFLHTDVKTEHHNQKQHVLRVIIIRQFTKQAKSVESRKSAIWIWMEDILCQLCCNFQCSYSAPLQPLKANCQTFLPLPVQLYPHPQCSKHRADLGSVKCCRWFLSF